MGVKDQGLQEYLMDNERFADFVNGTLFAGEQIVEARYLKEVQRKKRVSYKQHIVSTEQKKKEVEKHECIETFDNEECCAENYRSADDSGSNSVKLMYLERERDFLRLYDKPGCRLLFACEAESKANYEMPVRCFTYDGIEYTDQIKKWKKDTGKNSRNRRNRSRHLLVPIFHQVLYLGQERWLSKRKLREMMNIPKEVKKFSDRLSDYDICLTDIHEQDPQLFHTEWRDVFCLMKHSRKKEELKKYIEENKEKIQKLSEETRWFLAILLEQYTIVDDKTVEVRDVCEAWDGAMQMYADEARKETRKQMQEEMQKELKAQREKNQKELKAQERKNKKEMLKREREIVAALFGRGMSLGEIAEVLKVPLGTVQKWCLET